MRKDLVFASAILGFWVALNAYRFWNEPALDLTGIFFASQFFDFGQYEHIYSSAQDRFIWRVPPDAWQQLALSQGYPATDLSDYVYPPLWAAVFAPVAGAVSPFQFFNAFLIIGPGLFAIGVLAAWHLVGRPVSALVWACTTIVLLEFTTIGGLALSFFQPQLLVVGLLLIAFYLYDRGNFLPAAGIIALLASIKLTPIVFILIFVVDRRWKALGWFAIFGAALAALSIVLAGWPLHQEFLNKLDVLNDRILFSRINVSLPAVISFFWLAVEGEADWQLLGYEWARFPPAMVMVGSVLNILGLLVAAIIRMRNPDAPGLAMTILTLGLISTLLSPLGWLHYLIFVLAFAPGVFGFMAYPRSILMLAAFVLIFGPVVYEFLFARWVHYPMIYGTFWTFCLTLLVVVMGLRRDVRTSQGG